MLEMRQGKRIIHRISALLVSAGLVYGIDILVKSGVSFAVSNNGISFGIGVNEGQLVIISLLLVVLSLYWLAGKGGWWLILVLSGGWVNVYYRFTNGEVVDYWKIPFTEIYNNAADWVIFVGSMVGLGDIFKNKKDV